jgi:glucan phosphoethanolaminetransferase (alkaline phosphatase superfamily)
MSVNSPSAARPLGAEDGSSAKSAVRLRRRFGWLVALLPVIAVVGMDLSLRGGQLWELPLKYVASYTVAVLESAALWMVLLWASAARRGVVRWLAAAVFVLFFTLSVGGQFYFFGSYSCYLNLDATLFGTSFTESLLGQLEADGPHFARTVGPAFVLAVGIVFAARRMIRPRRRAALAARLLAPVCIVAVFLIPCSYRRVQASTPDVIYFHAIGGLIKQLTGVRTADQIRPGRRTPVPVPALTPRPAVQRNVVLLLTESIRFDAHCSEPVAACPVSPRSNEAAPGRAPLLSLRSSSSTTAIQLAVLWSGLQPTESREHLHSAPLLFDYAHAAGLETAYWTSHHMMFANSRLWVQDLPTRFQCGATDVEPAADIDLGGDDGLLVDRALTELPLLREPFFAVVHVGNTHVPYKVDPDDAPFQPASSSKAPEANDAYHNYYRNAVYLQDKAVGRFLREVRASAYGPRTVILFTADHGESFREHDQLGHTGSLFEEEIHVPGWVDAPPGLLTEEEKANIAERRDAPTFHTDVTPTVLDLLGLWDAPEIGGFKSAMVGESWLRVRGEPKPLLLTNCSGVWGCAFQNWGVMQGTRKLIAREWDSAWRCYDVATDPLEQRDLGPDACADLRDLAERGHGGFPGAR